MRWPPAATSAGSARAVIGGRTNHYSRVQLRYADYDFKPHDHDGIGWNWPITYQDIAPYYDKAERLIGVTGKAEGIRSAPDGIFQTPAALKPGEILVQKGCAKLGIRAINARQAVLTKAQDGRPACHYCGQCMRGCGTASNYASSYVQIFPAMKTGNVTVVTNAMARELITDDVRQGHGGVLHRQDRRAPSSRCAAGPWCCRRRRASRRGCCSTRSRRGIRRASPTRTARSAST